MPLTIIITTDMGDDGERFFDARCFSGLVEGQGFNLADVVGADSLVGLFEMLNVSME